MTPLAQAREIAKVSRQQQNVALRISGMRLKLIKKRMVKLGKPIDRKILYPWLYKKDLERF